MRTQFRFARRSRDAASLILMLKLVVGTYGLCSVRSRRMAVCMIARARLYACILARFRGQEANTPDRLSGTSLQATLYLRDVCDIGANALPWRNGSGGSTSTPT
jgi:hypothetical protein